MAILDQFRKLGRQFSQPYPIPANAEGEDEEERPGHGPGLKTKHKGSTRPKQWPHDTKAGSACIWSDAAQVCCNYNAVYLKIGCFSIRIFS